MNDPAAGATNTRNGGRNTSTNKRAQQQQGTADTVQQQQRSQKLPSTIPTSVAPPASNTNNNAYQVKRHAILGDQELSVYMRNLKSELNFATARTSRESIVSPIDDEQRRDLDAARKVNAETMKQLRQLEDMYESEHSIILGSINRLLAQLNYSHNLKSISELVDHKADIQAALKSELEIEIMQHKKILAAEEERKLQQQAMEVDDEEDLEEQEVEPEPAEEESVPNLNSQISTNNSYEELCESAVKISHDNFSTASTTSLRENNNSNGGKNLKQRQSAAQTVDNSTMTPAVVAEAPPASRPTSAAGNSFTVDIKDPKTGKRVHSFQSPAPLTGGDASNFSSEQQDVNMTAFTTAAALAGFKEMVKVDVFVRPDMILASDFDDADGGGGGKVTIELNSRELCGVYRCV